MLGIPKNIIITHFKNPHVFWYHFSDVPSATYTDVVALQDQLALHYKDYHLIENEHSPIVGKLVAVRYVKWSKFIRARVEAIRSTEKNDEDEFLMWAVDHGFPFKTKSNQVYPLLPKHCTFINHVKLGGIANLIPSMDMSSGFDMYDNEIFWSEEACEFVINFLKGATQIKFVGDHNCFRWGDLLVTKNHRKRFSVRKHLLNSQHAILSELKFNIMFRNVNDTVPLCFDKNCAVNELADDRNAEMTGFKENIKSEKTPKIVEIPTTREAMEQQLEIAGTFRASAPKKYTVTASIVQSGSDKPLEKRNEDTINDDHDYVEKPTNRKAKIEDSGLSSVKTVPALSPWYYCSSSSSDE